MGAGSKFDSNLATRGGNILVLSNDVANDNGVAQEILDEMEREGIKFSKDKIVFAAKLENGHKIFLETGGVDHAYNHHVEDFKRAFGISSKKAISNKLVETISKGKLIKSFRHESNGIEGYRSIYYYKGKYTVVYGISSNGYIITAFPSLL